VSSDNLINDGTVVTFGQVFAAGEIPSGKYVQATAGTTALSTQTDVKRRHADGSVRHAIVSVRLPSTVVAASTKASISLGLAASSTTATGTALTLADVTGSSGLVDYRVEIYEHGLTAAGAATPEASKTWTTTLKAALGGTTSQWIGGPLVSEWRARVAPKNLSTDHPGLRVIFDARYQNANQGRVSIAIENVESTAARGDRTYDISIYNATTGGLLVYSATNLLHYAQTRYRQVLYFGSGSKEMMAIADTNRLKLARAIPNYADITIPTTTIDGSYTAWLATSRGLFQNGPVVAYMGTTGGRPDIGPLPNWTALAMITRDPRQYQIMFDAAERAGYWGVHWRDSLQSGTTGANADIFSIDLRPTFALYMRGGSDSPYPGADSSIDVADRLAPTLLNSTGPSGWAPDTAHQPSLAYLPYLVTGDHYYLDELYFWASYNQLAYLCGWRGNEKGWVGDSQTRGQAWMLRTMGHAAWISPDADWQKDYFTEKLNNNLVWFRGLVLTSNTLGFWFSDWKGWQGITPGQLPNLSPQVAKIIGPWQHHFVAYALYELCERGYAATDLRDFALGFSTKLFTSAPDYDPLDGTAYYLPAQLSDSTVMNTMAQMKTYGFMNRTTPPITPLDSSNDPNGYAPIALAALAASVDAGIPNASNGYVWVRNEIMNQGNSNRQGFVNSPVWNIVPFGSVSGLTEAPGIYTK